VTEPTQLLARSSPAKFSAAELRAAVDSSYSLALRTTGGASASYIPYLATVDPSLLGVAIATVDGEVFEVGDTRYSFAIESLSKLFTMALAMDMVGAEEFHRRIGADPTGMPFNSVMALELHNDLPMSPLVNAGAISTVSLLAATDAEDRWQRILSIQSAFAGRELALSDEVNASEQATNYHNRAIAWLLKGGGAMYSDPMDACETYTRQCSTLVNTLDLAVMGASLASGGLNPLTGDRVTAADNVPHILAEMVMEGLYTRSGDWAYTVGLPAKSGVGGGILTIVPGQLAIAAFSPPLDTAGNSVRGQVALTHIAHTLRLGLYNIPETLPSDS
jgi:glutaminase